MNTCRLTPKVFTLLHEECLKRVMGNRPTGKIPVRQLYGFGDYNLEKPSLKKLIEMRGKVKNQMGENPLVNTKFFYDTYRGVKKGNAFVVLENYHSWVYFELLGYKDVEEFAKGMKEAGKLNLSEYIEQEKLFVNGGGLGVGKGYFACYHYSRLWHGIYAFGLVIDFGSMDYKDQISTYQVEVTSEMKDKEQQPLRSIGTAKHDGSNLIVDVKNTRGDGLKKMIFSMEGDPNNVSPNKVFLGAYLGISRNADIISGTICLVKKEENKDYSDAPLEIKRYLYLDKWQKRIPLEPLGHDMNKIPLERDSEDLLRKFVGRYRFCWLVSNGERLIESELVIKESFDFTIRTFMSENGVYMGRLFVQNNIACLNSIGLRRGDSGKKLSSSVFFDIKHISRQEEPDIIKGIYNLAGVTNFPKFGFCAIQKIDEPKKKEDSNSSQEEEIKEELIMPKIHSVDAIAANKNLKEMFEFLKKERRGLLEKQLEIEADIERGISWKEIFP